MKFFSMMLFGAVLSCQVFAAEVLKPANAADWSLIAGKNCSVENVTEDGASALKFTGQSGNFIAKKLFTIDPAKKYCLTAEFKVPAGAVKSRYYIGFVLYNAKNRVINSTSVNAIPGTDTVLAAPVKKGDKVIKIVNGSAWKASPLNAVAFVTKKDYADLPNFTAGNVVEKVEKKGNIYEVTLGKPCPYILKSGTGIRQHRYAVTYLYMVSNTGVNHEWQKFSGTIQGIAKFGIPKHQWWATAACARIFFISNSGVKNGVMLMRNLTFEEVK